MSREVTIRLPQEIGAWVRQQPGSCTKTVLGLAGGLWEGRRSLSVRDPGPGEDRLKVRLSARALRFIRGATHSRDATAALRKLLLWGYQGALPESPSLTRSLPVPRSRVSAAIVRSPASASLVPRAPRQLLSASDGRVIPFGFDGRPLLGDAALSISPVVAALVGRPAVSLSSSIVSRIPERVFTVVLPLAFLAAVCFLGRWLTAVSSAGKVVAGAAGTAAKAATVAPTVAAWTPSAASGLGALFL
jgi:hypothetical protein